MAFKVGVYASEFVAFRARCMGQGVEPLRAHHLGFSSPTIGETWIEVDQWVGPVAPHGYSNSSLLSRTFVFQRCFDCKVLIPLCYRNGSLFLAL